MRPQLINVEIDLTHLFWFFWTNEIYKKCKEEERADLTESGGVAGVGDVNESVLCKCLKSPHCPPVKFDISNHWECGIISIKLSGFITSSNGPQMNTTNVCDILYWNLGGAPALCKHPILQSSHSYLSHDLQSLIYRHLNTLKSVGKLLAKSVSLQ